MNTLPQGLASLPNEIILLIFDNITKITDKRQFLRTCVLYNNVTKQSILKYEINYFVKGFNKINKYCVEKFTLELCHDLYFDMIPMSYIIESNNILIKALAIFNCLSKLIIAKNNNCDISFVGYFAANYGHLDILKWGKENGCSWNANICSTAAQGGHLNILKWARENGCDWNEDTCSYAALCNHLDILKWARKNGCDWDDSVCSYAAKYNHLDILKWARTNGCDWNKYTCIRAAQFNNLECLIWARENGCDWDEYVCLNAEREGSLECLNWARANGCPEF